MQYERTENKIITRFQFWLKLNNKDMNPFLSAQMKRIYEDDLDS